MDLFYPIERLEIFMDCIIIAVNIIMMILLFRWRTDIIDKATEKFERVTDHYNTMNKNNLSDVTDAIKQLSDQWNSEQPDGNSAHKSTADMLLDKSVRRYH